MASASTPRQDAIKELSAYFGCLDTWKPFLPHTRTPTDALKLEPLASHGFKIISGLITYRITVDARHQLILIKRSLRRALGYRTSYVISKAYDGARFAFVASTSPHVDLTLLRSRRGIALGTPMNLVQSALPRAGSGCQGVFDGARNAADPNDGVFYHGDSRVDAIYVERAP